MAILGVTGCVLAAVPVRLAPSVGLNWGLQWLERTVARWIWAAANMRTPNEALRTLTARLVDDHLADGIVTACCPQAARVDTLAPQTCLAGRALKV